MKRKLALGMAITMISSFGLQSMSFAATNSIYQGDLSYLSDNDLYVSPIIDLVKDGFISGERPDSSVSLEQADMYVSPGKLFIQKPVVNITPNELENQVDNLSANIAYEGDMSEEVVTSIKGAWSTQESPTTIDNWVDLSRVNQEVTSNITDPGTYYYHVKMVLSTGDEVFYKSNKFIIGEAKDALAPILTISNPVSTWTNKDIELTVKAVEEENGSGVKSITLPDGVVVNSMVDKSMTLNAKYTVSSNGTYEFKVEDNAGNVATKSIEITNVDKVRPSTPKLTKATDKLMLTKSIDNLSGIDKHMYSLNNGMWTQFTGDLNLSNFTIGEHSIRVKAVDKATNESDISSLSFTVESTSNPALDNATSAVEKAESTKNQTDIDNARDAVDKLPEGPEKDDLIGRLDKIQAEIDAEKAEQDRLLQQAIAAVEKAETTKLQTDINTAYGLVNNLPTSQQKTELLARLDALKAQIETDKALEQAIAAVIKAEETEVQLYVDVAYKLVEKLPESVDKANLLKRLDELQLKIYYKELLAKATSAVIRAEKTKTEVDINNAYDLVNQLKESPEKTSLLGRLQAIKDAIQAEKDKQAQLLAEAIAAVEKAESSKTQIDVDNARTKVKALPVGTDKTELTGRLDKVQEEIDYMLKEADAIKSVERAESTKSVYDITTAYKKVNLLKEGPTKVNLLERLKTLEQEIAKKAEEDRIASEAIKAVERAELTKKDVDINSAKDKVALVKDEILRAELEERLLAIELAKEEVKEAENLKEAERLVRLAEIFRRNPHLLKAKTAVSSLSTSEQKLALQARLDTIEGKNGSGIITEEMKKEMTAESNVEKAEKYKYATLIRQAIKAVDALPESPKKEELQARIDLILAGDLISINIKMS